MQSILNKLHHISIKSSILHLVSCAGSPFHHAEHRFVENYILRTILWWWDILVNEVPWVECRSYEAGINTVCICLWCTTKDKRKILLFMYDFDSVLSLCTPFKSVYLYFFRKHIVYTIRICNADNKNLGCTSLLGNFQNGRHDQIIKRRK